METLIKPANAFTGDVITKFFPPAGERPGYGLMFQKTDMLRVLPGEVSIWSGINGHGKSLFLNEVVVKAAAQGHKSVIASLEMPAAKTLYRMVRQATGAKAPTKADITNCMNWLAENIHIYDLIGIPNVKKMFEEFRYAMEVEGVTNFIVDSLMKLGLGEDDYNGQKALMEMLTSFAMKTGAHIHLVAHARKMDNGEKEVPGKWEVLGASAITNMADNGYSVWRNKAKEEKVYAHHVEKSPVPAELAQQHDAVLSCWKSREHGSDVERKYGLYYHWKSMQYHEDQGMEAIEYCETAGAPF